MKTLIHNAKVINEGERFTGSVLIEDEFIRKIYRDEVPKQDLEFTNVVEAQGKYLIPGNAKHGPTGGNTSRTAKKI